MSKTTYHPQQLDLFPNFDFEPLKKETTQSEDTEFDVSQYDDFIEEETLAHFPDDPEEQEFIRQFFEMQRGY